MKFTSVFFGIIIFGLIGVVSSLAQSVSLKPALVRMENKKLTVGVDFEAKYQKEYTLTSETEFPRLIQFDANADATLLFKPKFNPKRQNLNLFLGYLISFKKAQELALGEEPEPSRDYGSLGLGITANYEANQTFTEQIMEQGIELRYVNSANSFLPILEASYLFSVPFRSEIRNELNESNDFYQRLEVRAFWVIRIRRFVLNPDFRYFRSLDLSDSLNDAGLDKGLHSAISLGYVFEERDAGPLQFFEYIYLQYNRGQFPVYLDNRETVEAGVTFTF